MGNLGEGFGPGLLAEVAQVGRDGRVNVSYQLVLASGGVGASSSHFQKAFWHQSFITHFIRQEATVEE